ncbi:MAG: GntR family transcriptional regulator [Dorea sp.]
MPWELDNDRPIYLQLMESIQRDIIAGVYQPGDKLPSVRDLAVEAAVNPNTMQKALSELERNGLVHSYRTSGRFITEDKTMLRKMKEQQASRQIKEFIEKMRQLGYQDPEILSLIKETINGGGMQP